MDWLKSGRGVTLSILLLTPFGAQASHYPAPVPVNWEEDVDCIEMVDRSSGETEYELRYSIASELERPEGGVAGEVSNGRTHRFYAFCEDPFWPYPPAWIDAEDVEQARADGVVGPDYEPETLEGSPAFPCWEPINSSDDWRPITFEAADEPLVWDVSRLPEGVYSIWGYTWHPPWSGWSPRSRTVVVVHDGEPERVGPIVVVTSGELITYEGEPVVLEGCVDAGRGSTLTVEYMLVEGAEPGPWEVGIADIPAEGGRFSVDLSGVFDGYVSAWIRVRATDRDGRESVGTMHGRLTQLVRDECESGFVTSCVDPDPASRNPLEPPESTKDASQSSGHEGGCRVAGPSGARPWLAFMLVLVGLGASRRGAQRSVE